MWLVITGEVRLDSNSSEDFYVVAVVRPALPCSAIQS